MKLQKIEKKWIKRRSICINIFLFSIGLLLGTISSMKKISLPSLQTGSGIIAHLSISLIIISAILLIIFYFIMVKTRRDLFNV